MIIVLILIALVLIFLWLVHPNLPRRDASHLLGRDYAHRGLWGSDVPENSLAGFRRAAEQGYGIELDVRLTGDGHLVVHHDSSTQRMCGADMLVKETSLETLRTLHLNDTEERIPTFDEVLETVAGRVPLIVELKVERDAAELAKAVYERMKRYDGSWCMESFFPTAVQWFRRNAPEVIRGQLSFGVKRRRASVKLLLRDIVLGSLMVNVLSRPDFIAYEHQSDKPSNLPLRIVRAMNPLMVCWTVRSQADMTRLRKSYDIQIFEKFIPSDKPVRR